MIKKKKILLSLIVVVLCVCITMLAFACSKDDEKQDDEDVDTEDTALITNGDFTKYSTEDDGKVTYPVAPSGWTGTPGSTSSSQTIRTPQSADDISVGVISVDSDYKDNQEKYGISNPGPAPTATDKKVLMIHNIKETSYSYVSSSITIAQDTYYKLSFWVKTAQISPSNYGAYVYIKGSAYVEIENIQTDDWKEYTVYFRGSNTGDKTITISLGLGEGDLANGRMVSGYAYFDHVVLTDLTNVEGGQTEYKEADLKFDLRALDGNFNYTSTVATKPLYNTSQLTGSAGTGSGSAPSTGSSYLEKGILNFELAGSKAYTGYDPTPFTLEKAVSTDIGNKAVMIHNKQLTAYTLKDNIGMLIENKKYYKITIYAQTRLNPATQAGAYIALNSSEAELESFDNVQTGNTWKQYTFYVEGNQYVDNTLYVSMSLGKGGSGDSTWAQGVAFFDDLFYDEVELTKDQYNAIVEDETTKKYSYYDAELDADLIALNKFSPTVYEDSFIALNATETDIKAESPFYHEGSTTTYLDYLKIENKKLTAYSASTITKNTDGSANDANKIAILPNKAYKISFWVKTEDLNDGASASVALFSYDTDKSDDYDNCKTTIATMSTINETNLKSYLNADYDNYVQVSMYVLGDIQDTKYVGLSITFGSGDSAAQSASLASGKFYIANLRMVGIDYDDYNSASTGTTTFKYSFVGSGESGEISSNGMFDYVDMSSTISLYGDAANTVWNTTTGKLEQYAVPTNWSVTDSSVLTAKGGASKAGVIDIANFANASDYSASLGLGAGVYDDIETGLSIDVTKQPQILLIDAQNVAKYLGFKSSSISLSANSYYVFSVYVRSDAQAAMSVAQSGASDQGIIDSTLRYDASTNEWNHMLIYVRTGITSTNVYVTLYAGAPTNDFTTSACLFTMATYTSIDETIYKKATEVDGKVKKIEWFTDTMDTTSSAASDTDLATPSNWTGAAIDSNASTASDDLVKGLLNQKTSNWSLVDIDPDKTDSYKDTIFTGDAHNDSVLLVYNKTAGSYGYTSPSFTLEKNTIYKISIDVLVKDLAYLKEADIDSDDSKYENWKDKNLYETATIIFTANNKTYTFGKATEKDKTADSFTGDTATDDYNAYLLAKDRQVNPSEWTTYTYYISLANDIEDSVSGTVKINLGGKSVSYWESGYVFADNFTVEKIDAIPTDITDDVLNPANEGYNATLAAKTYRITYTNEDAQAEEDAEEEEEEEKEENKESKNWLWLYITSGIIGGLLVIILVIYIVKKYAPKKGIKKAKKTLTSDNASRGKFGN